MIFLGGIRAAFYLEFAKATRTPVTTNSRCITSWLCCDLLLALPWYAAYLMWRVGPNQQQRRGMLRGSSSLPIGAPNTNSTPIRDG